MSQHRFEVATRKEDIVGRNEEIMSRQGSKAEWTCNVSAKQFQVATKDISWKLQSKLRLGIHVVTIRMSCTVKNVVTKK